MQPVSDSIAKEIFLLQAGYDALEYKSPVPGIDCLAR